MAIDPTTVDWKSTRRAAYLIRQSFDYQYPQPIHDLNHRLVVIPPERLGDQRRLWHDLRVRHDAARIADHTDRFGNVVFDVFAPRVLNRIEFVAEVSVERQVDEPNRLAGGWPAAAYLLEPSALTKADERILRAAGDLSVSADWGVELADRINDWVYQSMTYRGGVTGVRTTAAEALALGAGVCQDYAHVMLAVCRACGLPARYVSGHLLGMGGTHAWVEVLLPAPDSATDAVVHAFDPTHASRGGLDHVTVAVGADYLDVAPTSGTYTAGVRGRLTASKRVSVVDVG